MALTGIASILKFSALLGLLLLCIILVITGILRWLKPTEKRQKRLNRISIAAFAVLLITFMLYIKGDIGIWLVSDECNDTITNYVINASKISIKLLMLGIVVSSIIILIGLLFYFIINILKAVFHRETNSAGTVLSLSEKLGHMSKEINAIMQTSLVKFVVTWGILAVFIILPLLMGGQESPTSMAQTWINGVHQIAVTVTLTEPRESAFYLDLAAYVFIYIIVLGVGFAAIKILYAIIGDTFTRKHSKTLLDEYSGSIGILTVGVSLLWAIQGENFSGSLGDKILSCVEAFGAVIFIIALAVLTLEVIRLLMDMREKLIRQEARYLFVFLAGKIAILLLKMVNSIYEAANTAIGNTINNGTDRIQRRIQEKMIQAMEEQLENCEDGEKVFSGFDEQVTKK